MINNTEKILLVIAMAGIGMKISMENLLKQGRQALLLGILSWSTQIGYTLFLVFTFFQKSL